MVGTIEFSAGGAEAQELNIPLIPNEEFEFDETFTVKFSNPVGVVFEEGAETFSVTLTITDEGSVLAVENLDGKNGFRFWMEAKASGYP